MVRIVIFGLYVMGLYYASYKPATGQDPTYPNPTGSRNMWLYSSSGGSSEPYSTYYYRETIKYDYYPYIQPMISLKLSEVTIGDYGDGTTNSYYSIVFNSELE